MAEFASFDGTRLYYEEEGAGQPTVLLHGLSSSIGGNWKEPGIWAALATPGRRVIGLDARGHGRSDKPHDPAAYANEAMARDVDALFAHLGLQEADVVGYSMGAGTALRFAARDQRVRRLVVGGIGGDPAKWGAAGDERADMAKRWLDAMEADDAGSITDPVGRRARKIFEARHNDLRAIAALLRGSRHLTADIAVSAVAAPTLVVCGDKDRSPHPLAAALPRAEALVLDGDHEGVVSNPELAKAIAEFLSD